MNYDVTQCSTPDVISARSDLVWLGVELWVLHDVCGGGAEADAVRVAKRREAAASPLLQETAVLHRVHLAVAQA